MVNHRGSASRTYRKIHVCFPGVHKIAVCRGSRHVTTAFNNFYSACAAGRGCVQHRCIQVPGAARLLLPTNWHPIGQLVRPQQAQTQQLPALFTAPRGLLSCCKL